MPRPLVNLRHFGLTLERSFKQHRWLWRYAHCKRVFDSWSERTGGDAVATSRPDATRRCLLDLRRIASDGEQGRRFHALVMLLRRGGYELSMVPRLAFLQTGHRTFKANALSQTRPFFEDQLPADFCPFDLCLSDGAAAHRYARRTLPVLTGTQKPLQPGDLAMPYSFFPAIWDHGEDQRFEDYRSRARVWRIFFGGHCSEASYRRINKYTRLQPVERHRVVREVNRYFYDSTLWIDCDEQLESAQRQRHESFVMIDNAVYRPDASRWLGLLAQSDFFLAAPGCDYPLSHNAIEAIAVGTIPVLEYNSLFTPPLSDGENCITYQGIDGLRRAAARIETMDERQIIKLRRGVIDYYESHLSPAAFCRDLENQSTKRLHLFPYLTPAAKQAA
ncbi:hypothetical protein [Planctomycetes bacterium TBK1r]|uniref:Exostosin family protein n=2 Tax=Stieleria TaxID=2795973 RepID=A0ABX5XQI5_9BACT|nr:hypothetical protein TBK1r_32180 [Planctomycetes bacterium TBK1r]